MAVQFVLGAAGTGKTEYLYREVIRQAAEHRDRSYYFIVPEQFTLQTQRDLVERNPVGGILNIDVTSLARLAHQVFAELGGEKRTVLKDIGKSMVVRRILTECREELTVFASNARQSGFVEEVKSLISEFLQYGVCEEQLSDMARSMEQEAPLLSKKLSDLTLLLQAFRKFLGTHYLTPEGIYDVLAECVWQSRAFRDCVIVLDGFTGFTPSQYALLKELMRHSRQLYVSLTVELSAAQLSGSEPMEEHELFHMTWKSLQKLSCLAKEAGVPVEAPILCDWEDPAENPVLRGLRQSLFRYRVGQKQAEEKKTGQSPVTLFLAESMEAECRYAVTQAVHLIQEEGYRYREIAVITSDIELYGERLVREFEKAGIPCFLDYKKNMSGNLCADYVRAVLQLAEQGPVTEQIIAYVKCGLSGWGQEDVWELENYCLATGVRGTQFRREWTRTYRTRRKIDLTHLNELRKRILSELEPLWSLFGRQGATVRDWTTGLFFFLKERGIQQRLKEQEEAFSAQGELLLAREYAQVYRVLLELFDQLVELLSEEQLTAREYRELVETGLHEAKVGLVPVGAEQVVIGDVERTRLKDIRALFFLGVNDGKIPSAGNARGILCEKDRSRLAEAQMELTPSGMERMSKEQFYLYNCMAKPKQRLYVTCSAVSEEGKAIRPSYLMGKLLAAVPGSVLETEYTDRAEALAEHDLGRQAFLREFRSFAKGKASTEFAELYRFWKSREKAEAMQALLRAALMLPEEENLTEKTARALYGETLFGSVTRLEQYAGCAFSHFLNYGMRLEPRAEYRLAAPEIGSVYHDALRRYGESLLERNQTWKELTQEERRTLTADCAAQAVAAAANDIFLSSARNRYLVGQIEQTLEKTVEVLTRQLEMSRFSPAALEQKFEHRDRNLNLYGIIDRYDLCTEGETTYLKIMDYKSGTKDFDLTQLYYGLTTQLAVYLAAALRKLRETPGQKVVPAAMFYYHIADPFVNKTDDPEREQLKRLRVKGLVNEDTAVICALDGEFRDAAGGLRASVRSLRIPVETNKDGVLTKRSCTASAARIEQLTDFVYRKLKEEGDAILSGDAAIAPYQLGKHTGCDFCEYAAVCGFDQRNGSRYRRLASLSEEELWQKLN